MHTAPKGSSASATATKRPLWSYIAVVVLFLLAVLMQFFAENGERIAEGFQSPRWLRHTAHTASNLFGSRFVYMSRPTEARYVALVSISRDSEGAMGGACGIRSFIATLLPRIALTGPAMIVSDVAFTGDEGNDVCPAKADETQKLASGILAAAKAAPVVMGQASYTLSELPRVKAQQLEEQGFAETDLLLRNPLAVQPKPADLAFGLIRLNQDVERVPVVWFAHDTATSGARPVPSLALVAAELYRSGFPNGDSRLKTLEGRLYHPIAQLLPESAFAVVPAIRLTCATPAGTSDWQHCAAPPQVDDSTMKQLHGRVVVIGFSDDPNDQWKTSVGQVPGYVLHANYIEALLDERAYRPLGFWGTCLLSVIWLFIVELPFGLLEWPFIKALSFAVLASVVVLFLAKYIALVNFGLYISPFPPSILLITVSIVHLVARRFEG